MDELPDIEGRQGFEEARPVMLVRPGEPGEPAVADDGLPLARPVQHAKGVTVVGADDVLPADPGRTALTIRNASDTRMTFRVDGVDAQTDDYPLDPGRGYEFPPNMVPEGAVSVYCGTAGKAWNALFSTRTA